MMAESPAFVVLLYGRRFLRLTPPDDTVQAKDGWRSVTWTKNMDDACRWSSPVAAEKFAAINLHGEFVIRAA
jgi:hypothetical protein